MPPRLLPSPYLAAINKAAITTTLAAQDTAEALIALGWPVLPHGPDMDLWQIGDLIWTDHELMGLAARHGVRPVTSRVH